VNDTPGTAEEKRALRQRLLAARAALPAAERAAGDARRDAELLAWLAGRCPAGTTVALYASLGTEPATGQLRAELRRAGVRVVLPRLLPDGALELLPDTGVLVPGLRGTQHPGGAGPAVPATELAAVVVPGLAGDMTGGRLGRGGGSYDRLLARLDPRVAVVLLLHEGEVLPAVPREPHDRRVGALALPSGVRPCVQGPAGHIGNFGSGA
jgi:5-formyltetrahydrofolate cyclo-ligase